MTRCQFITALGAQPARRIAVNSRRSTGTAAVERAPGQPDAHGLPREAGGCLGGLLGANMGFPNRGLRLQPAATGRPGGVPLGTRLGTRMPVEEPNL
jgi:hypothetical protein